MPIPIPSLDPYLVTLGLDPAAFERLDRLRARYFPPDRNVVPAHLSLFHQLPGDAGDQIGSTLRQVARSSPPVALTFSVVKRIGRGVMVVVEAQGLAAIRSVLAGSFSGWLTLQDRQPFRPHVTIMNKAEPAEAGRAFEEIRSAWAPFAGSGVRLLLWRSRGGPWEEVDSFDLLGVPVAGDPNLSASRPEG